MCKGYRVIEFDPNVDKTNVKFIRIVVDDPGLTISNILKSLMDQSWLSNIKDYLRLSYEERMKGTVDYIAEKFRTAPNSGISTETGEKVVSESARLSVIEINGYKDIPLGELFKQQVSGNPGFDFFSENTKELYVLFGEAKYVGGRTPYNKALTQIEEFKNNGNLKKDIADLDVFCEEESLRKASQLDCGFMAAFSCTKIKSADILTHVKNTDAYKALKDAQELILIAVEV